MKFISWNVNGLRAVRQKGFEDVFRAFDADFFCVQETKLQEGQIDIAFDGYESYWCYAERKGYSGTAVFTRHTPIAVTRGIGCDAHDREGRVLTLEMPDFYLVNVYVPNSQGGLARLPYRLEWEECFRNYLMSLDAIKPVVVCGDFNVAHADIDLKNPKSNRGSCGFTDEERAEFSRLIDAGFVDTFRYKHPDAVDCYTWWSYMYKAREKNAGWRIDYFLVSQRIAENIDTAVIHPDIMGSDHCPVELSINWPDVNR